MDFFGTKKSTVGNKAAEIRKMLKMRGRLTNTEFMTDGRPETNPMLDYVMVDGFIMPISELPPEYQEMVKNARAQGKDIQFRSN